MRREAGARAGASELTRHHPDERRSDLERAGRRGPRARGADYTQPCRADLAVVGAAHDSHGAGRIGTADRTAGGASRRADVRSRHTRSLAAARISELAAPNTAAELAAVPPGPASR